MQSGLPLKNLYTSCQMRRRRCRCPVKNTRFTSVDMMADKNKKKKEKAIFYARQNAITYAQGTIYIRYANQFSIIL